VPITLITGLPGHGKTLYALKWVSELAAKDGRVVFHNGIRGLKLPWVKWEPERWQELEAGAVMVIDECQSVFPVRGRGQPPAWIEELAKHRHLGVDFVVITQNPMLMDSFVRRLVDRHFHIVRTFGTHKATVHEFANGCKENVDKSREGSIRHDWLYPTKVFEWYESAELHTVKRRVPMRVWFLISLPFVLAVLVWWVWQRWDAKTEAPSAPAGAASAPLGATQAAAGQGAAPERDYFATHAPRVEGLAYTAPVYDVVTQPVQAPYPAACVASAQRCRCYTQQGTRLEMPDALCRDLTERGFFVPWQQVALASASPQQSASSAAVFRPPGR
jgi:zona occludens toxin